MLVLAWIRKIYKTLSADASPAAIAFAAAFGLTLGLVPFGSGISLLLILTILIFRVQISAALLFVAIGKLAMALGLYVPLAELGGSLLESESLRRFWDGCLDLPVVAVLDLHQHVTLGAFLAGIGIGGALFVPLRLFVIAYRRWAHERLSQNRFFRWVTNFWFTKLLRFVFVGGEP
jgi:uncharacterized protein (TIGR03546 family)